MSLAILENIINDFDLNQFRRFFASKNRSFKPDDEPLDYFIKNNEKELFGKGEKLGSLDLPDGDLLIAAFAVKKELTERSGKKAQYELGKRILRDANFQRFNAGIFIFYDKNGNFRFSLIYDIPKPKGRDWSNFRRFTYYVSKDLTNKTFRQRIGNGDFSNLEKIKEAFSVEKITKEFYKKLANWYFWTIRNVEFPKHAEEKKNGREMAVIRLITRLIFVWFMKQKGLVPEYLFKKEKLTEILKDLSEKKSTYYKAILQNLFFATLNTPQDKRRFTNETRGYKGYNPDFGNHNVYRYHELFKNSEKIKDYFGEIPFLNGGLFECLDIKAKNKEDRRYIDGFTRVKKYQPKVPNFLFFSEERQVDLNEDYGTKNKKYPVEGIINLLSSYNFTIDENTPDDQDVALDPELLGKVFENLLASFNPETATTARKATGSYYTPREIVDYMVTESLKAYFKTHLSDIKDLDQKLELLFSKENEENPFNQEESKRIVNLIDNLRIVDPAVGSGAFPMGILNKLVFILNKIDPGNNLWKQTQLSAAEKIPDPIIKQKVKENIEKFFREKNPDYGRKLYLIQKCIYGVDIQEIAVEIAKLRFFISLLVDEKIDKTKPNWGIEPLPNLDFKLMVGNSLIDKVVLDDTIIEIFNLSYLEQTNRPVKYKNLFEIDPQEDLFSRLRKSEVAAKVEEFIKKKEELFRESDFEKKRKLKEEINSLENEIIRLSLQKELEQVNSQLVNKPSTEYLTRSQLKQKQELEKKQKFLQQLINDDRTLNEYKHKNIFLWHLYFIEVFLKKGGFDIVIANPPYINSREMSRGEQIELRRWISRKYKWTKGSWDIYIAFFELGFNLMNFKGTLTFITPDKWLGKSFGDEFRKATVSKVLTLIKAGRDVFEASNVDSIISFYSGADKGENKLSIMAFVDREFLLLRNFPKYLLTPPYTFDYLFSDYLDFLLKLGRFPKMLSDLAICENACATDDAYKLKPLIKEINWNTFNKDTLLKVVNTGTISKWCSRWGRSRMTYLGRKYLRPVVDKEAFLKIFGGRLYAHRSLRKKLIIKGLNLLDACIDDEGIVIPGIPALVIVEDNVYKLKLLLAILNSRLVFFYIKERYPSSSYNLGINFTPLMLNKLPIPEISEKNKMSLIDLVDRILTITKESDYLANPVKQAKVREYEKQIDQLVYKLYGLTEEEIGIIENNT